MIGQLTESRRDWEGPSDIYTLNLTSAEHTETVRYHSAESLEPRFDFYVPLFLLDLSEPSEASQSIRIQLSRSYEPRYVAGFRPQRRPLRAETGLAEAESVKEMGRIYLYKLEHDGRTHNFYVPKAVFEDLEPPRTLYVFVEASA